MKLKISTPAEVIYQGEVNQISLPTENGTLHISAGHAPIVASIKPGLIQVQVTAYDKPGNTIFVSTTKGMAFVDGKVVRIVSADATINPTESIQALDEKKLLLEHKISQLRKQGSIEEIESNSIKLEKVQADILLKHKLHTR